MTINKHFNKDQRTLYLDWIEQAFEHSHNFYTVVATALRVDEHDQGVRIGGQFNLHERSE